MPREAFAGILVLAVLSAGCTGGLGGALSLNGASLSDPSFDISPESGDAQTVFKVDARGLGEKYNVTWDWGDGVLSYGEEAEHKYGFTNGVMTITLVATDSDGTQGIASRTVTLGSGENKVPTVTARAQRTWVEVGRTINVSATGVDGDRDPLTYFWSYTTLDAPAEKAIAGKTNRVPVTFDAPGLYDVKVRARDPKGGEAVGNVTVIVTSTMPETRLEQYFNGTILAGSAANGASEKLWGTPAPDTGLDSVRHRFTLEYPAFALLFLTWNDTTAVPGSPIGGAQDLDLELRKADGTVVFTSATRGPPNIPFEFNLTQVDAGEYDVVVRGYTAANLSYTVLLQATLQISGEMVLAKEQGA